MIFQTIVLLLATGLAFYFIINLMLAGVEDPDEPDPGTEAEQLAEKAAEQNRPISDITDRALNKKSN